MAGRDRSYRVRRRFLEQLEKGFSPSKAAREAGQTLASMKRWREEDENFAKDWEDAEATGTHFLEDVARNRAVRKSDALLVTLLKARDRKKYSDKQEIEHSGSVDLSGARERVRKKLAKSIEAEEKSSRAS